MKVHLAAALLLASLLAGCSSGKEDDGAAAVADAFGSATLYLNVTVGGQTYRFTSGGLDAASTSGSASVSASATGTGTGSATGNATGGAGGNATAGNGTGSAGGKASGEAPLNVSVTLGAKGLPAGKAFTWTLDWGDSGSAGNATGGAGGGAGNATKSGRETGSKLPATAEHTYTSAGNHTLRFSLAPANGTGPSATTVVQVTAPTGNGTGNQSAAPGTTLGTLLLDQEGSLTAALQGLDCSSAQGVDQDASFPWEFPAADANGTPAVVSRVLLTLDQGSSTLDASLHFIGPDGETIESADAESVDGEPHETLDLEGPFEPGAYTVKVVGCVAAGGDFTLHGEATLVAA